MSPEFSWRHVLISPLELLRVDTLQSMIILMFVKVAAVVFVAVVGVAVDAEVVAGAVVAAAVGELVDDGDVDVTPTGRFQPLEPMLVFCCQ